MIEVLQWFDSKDRVVGLIVVMGVFFWGLAHVVSAFRGNGNDL